MIKFKLSVYYGLFSGLSFGLLYLTLFIEQNRYLPDNLHDIYWYLLQHSTNRMVIIGIFVIAAVVISGTIFRKYLHIMCSTAISLAGFAVVGYYLNKNVLPNFYSWQSLVTNGALLFLFLILGIIFRKYCHVNFHLLEKLYNRWAFAFLMVVFLVINILGWRQGHILRYFPIEKNISDEKLLELFNLDLTGLEKVKKFYDAREYQTAMDKLIEYYINRDDSTWKFNVANKAGLDSAYFIKRATEAVNHEFSIRGLSATMPSDINWVESPKHTNKEWIYRFNTHYWWSQFAYAYLLTGDEKYALEFNSQLVDWIYDNPVISWKDESKPTWRLLETGCRLMDGWPVAFQIFSKSKNFPYQSRKLMLASIFNQAQFLRLFKSPQRNHLLFESMGLASAGIFFPEFKNSSIWRKVAFTRINHLIDTEINDDGSYVELALNYHKIVADLFDDVKDLARRCKDEVAIDSTRLHKIENLFDFIAKVSRPDGMLPGVNDGHSVECRDILAMAASKYNRQDFQFVASGYREGTAPIYKSCALPDAGFYVMRTAWDSLANYLFLDGGPFGSAHGHEDKLNIEVYAFGKIFLVDPGTYTYNASDKFRWYFLRSSSHNTVIVDGKSQARFWDKKAWVYHNSYKNDNFWRSTDKYDFVVASYKDGYGNYKENIDRSVNHTRRILFVKPDYWIISDVLEGKGEHLFQQLFHFMPMVVRQSKEKAVCTLNKSEANLAIIPVNESDLQLDLFTGSEDPLQGWVAPNFHKKLAAPAIVYSKKEQAPTMFNVVLFPASGKINLESFHLEKLPVKVNNQEVNQNKAICLKFSTKEWIDYILLSKNIPGTKTFGDFSSDKDIAYFKVNKANEVITQFEFKINE